MGKSRSRSIVEVLVPLGLLLTGCSSFGPQYLQESRLRYNEVVKTSSEEQLLLNIVRLRYGDTPSSLAVSSVAAQFELAKSFQLTPFFVASGAAAGSYAAVLPQLSLTGTDRPTISLTPADDQEFTRKLFTPLPLDGLIYLAKTTWPIATVFRLYLENLNWVPNAQTASGPTPRQAPVFEDFLRGVLALEALQARGQIVFSSEERAEPQGSALPAAAVTARDLIEAAKNGFEYRREEGAAAWTLVKKTQQPVLLVHPQAVSSPEMGEVVRVFRLKPGLTRYLISQEALNPFPVTYPADGVEAFDFETRSLLQALYFVSHGVDIPTAHLEQELVTTTRDESGQPFDWRAVLNGLFRVASAPGSDRPKGAQVAIPYRGHWFYIDERDQPSKATFSLLMELARLELVGRTAGGPILTLPLSGR